MFDCFLFHRVCYSFLLYLVVVFHVMGYITFYCIFCFFFKEGLVNHEAIHNSVDFSKTLDFSIRIFKHPFFNVNTCNFDHAYISLLSFELKNTKPCFGLTLLFWLVFNSRLLPPVIVSVGKFQLFE